MNFSWECPHCNRSTTIVETNEKTDTVTLAIHNADGMKQLKAQFIVCPSEDCNKYALKAELYDYEKRRSAIGVNWEPTRLLKTWQLIPESGAKVFPDYIPEAILNDYQEACLIRDLSPKASATLARRCLQGMIRNFWGETRSRLVDEIEAIKDKVAPEVWDSIDAVRGVGNIGAHMEKDIDLIIDVDPNEAQLLIELIEQLLNEWYVEKHKREDRLAKITKMAHAKGELKKNGKAELEVGVDVSS